MENVVEKLSAREINKRRNALDKNRREYMDKVMEEYDKEYHKELAYLREICPHKFSFSGFGPLGHTWYYCDYCGKSKVDKDY